MGHIDVNSVSFSLTVGQRLLDQVSFTVGEREHVALIGANGVGKTTMLRLIAGVEQPNAGVIGLSGSVAFMRQMTTDDSVTVRDLYLSLSPERYQNAAAQLARAEKRLADTSSSAAGSADGTSSEDAGLRYAKALTQWEDLGGYDLEVTWAASADRAVGNGWSALA
ncbi:MAG: ATP-binding cassette domain-containing protein, partial [bacterium]|nr:ATP-binding cassette domain-containing protein [bacterium]